MVLCPSERRLYDHLHQSVSLQGYAPTIQEIKEALHESSTSLVQDLLDRLQQKGYIARVRGKARAIALQQSELPLKGLIQAGYLTEHPEGCDRIRLDGQRYQAGDYALRVTGDSMVNAQIFDGDMVVIRPEDDLWALRDGQIAVVWIAGEGATLKHIRYGEGDPTIALIPANANHPLRRLDRDQVEVQGVMVGHHRCDNGLWMAATSTAGRELSHPANAPSS